MKKLLSVAALLAMLSLASCGGTTEETTTETPVDGSMESTVETPVDASMEAPAAE